MENFLSLILNNEVPLFSSQSSLRRKKFDWKIRKSVKFKRGWNKAYYY